MGTGYNRWFFNFTYLFCCFIWRADCWTRSCNWDFWWCFCHGASRYLQESFVSWLLIIPLDSCKFLNSSLLAHGKPCYWFRWHSIKELGFFSSTSNGLVRQWEFAAPSMLCYKCNVRKAKWHCLENEEIYLFCQSWKFSLFRYTVLVMFLHFFLLRIIYLLVNFVSLLNIQLKEQWC